ncbi:MAG: nucleoside-diphosphate sugar epimerase/dehydratase [Burkholderiaceae bacterium]
MDTEHLLQNRSHALRERLLALAPRNKRMLQIAADILLIWLALWLAFFIRLGDASVAKPLGAHAWLFAAAPLISIPLFIRYGLYRAVMRYLGPQALSTIARVVTVAAALLAIAVYLYGSAPAIVPRSTVVIYWLLSLLLIGGLRVLMRHYFNNVQFGGQALPLIPNGGERKEERKRVAIYGAGAAGNRLLEALRLGGELLPVGFIDDNSDLDGRIMAGLQVYCSDRIGYMLHDTGTEEILLAIPSASRMRRSQIMNRLTPYSVPVRTLPGLMDLAAGRVHVEALREVQIDDLLGRDPVDPDPTLFARCIRGQVVMVTGAGGSIGSELCRQIVRNMPQVLVLFEHSEFALYAIQRELEAHISRAGLPVRIVPILGSVRNSHRLRGVMKTCKVNTVYHAAAYKHVPLVENNIAEGIINNTFGTLHAAQAALCAGVDNFVLISTDKAVRPTNVMGGTKRMAELVLQALAQEPRPMLYGAQNRRVTNRTRYTMVRFGNVLGSSGSVIPLFKQQIRQGGPVTVTHPEITRYFMTIPEAAQLVIQAGSMGQGGDVFVLDMGEPVKITELAEKMVQLSGLSVRGADNADGDIEIRYTGLRPGEKLYEELLIGDNVSPTEHPMIMRANEKHLDWETLKEALAGLDTAIQAEDYPRSRELFYELVDGYTANDEIVDLMYQERGNRCDYLNVPL